MTNRIHELMPEFARHEGRWTGTYTHITPTGEVLDHHAVHILAEFPNDGTADFRLNTHNVWGDGRSERGVYEAHYRDGRLWFEKKLIGSLWVIDDMTVYLRFGFEGDDSIQVCEMIQISKDGKNRARTWHWFQNEKLFKITLTHERRDD